MVSRLLFDLGPKLEANLEAKWEPKPAQNGAELVVKLMQLRASVQDPCSEACSYDLFDFYFSIQHNMTEGTKTPALPIRDALFWILVVSLLGSFCIDFEMDLAPKL